MSALLKALGECILVLDGAMGTMIQRAKLTDAEYRGQRFGLAARSQGRQ